MSIWGFTDCIHVICSRTHQQQLRSPVKRWEQTDHSLVKFVLQTENATFLEEIDSTSRIYEQTQGENSHLLKRMLEGDARLSQLAGEQLKHGQTLEHCRGQLHLAKLDCNHAGQLKQVLERQVQELQTSLQVSNPIDLHMY